MLSGRGYQNVDRIGLRRTNTVVVAVVAVVVDVCAMAFMSRNNYMKHKRV